MKIDITVPEEIKHWYLDIAKAMFKCCIDAGHDTRITLCQTLDDYGDADLVVVCGAHYFAEKNIHFLKKPEGVKWAWVQLEQLPYTTLSSDIAMRRWHQTVQLKEFFDVLIVESPEKKLFLSSQGVENVLVFNCGYHPLYDIQHKLPEFEGEPQYDVLFYGAITSRRREVLNELLNNGVKLYPFPAKFMEGKDKLFAMRNSKLVLNIHMNDVPYFEKPRLIVDCWSNRNFVVTEHIAYPEVFQAGEHYVSADYDNIANAVKESLKLTHGDRRAVADSAYKHLVENYRLEDSMEQLLVDLEILVTESKPVAEVIE